MINAIVSVGTYVAEHLADLGVAAAKKHLNEKLEEKRLHESLMKYIESHKKYNEVCSLAEEIDFQGLVEYIDDRLLDDIESRFFSPNSQQRDSARKSIIDHAVTFSKANTVEAQKRVTKLIADALDIIREFYKKDIDKKDWLLAGEIVGAVTEEIRKADPKDLLQKIDSNQQVLASKIDATHQALNAQLTVESFWELAKNGDLSDIKGRLELIATAISKRHPLAPDYGFDLQLKSQPLTMEAHLKYPPKIECNGIVKMGKQIIQEITSDTLDYADRHQLIISLEITEAKKLLGNVEDPSQEEARQLVGRTMIRKPKEFPAAFPCNIQMNGEIIIEYVMLRTEEILDDGTYVVGNKEQQDCNFRINMAFNLEDRTKKTHYSMSMQEKASAREYLNFAKLMKTASEGGSLAIYALNFGKFLMEGNTDPFEYKSGFKDVDEEIDFLSRVCDIEDYCGKQMILPEKILEHEYSQIIYLSDLIRGEETEYIWTSLKVQAIVTQHFRDRIAKMSNDFAAISVVGSHSANVYGINIEIPIIRTFRDAKIKEFDKFKKRLKYTDDNDAITIPYIPGENNVLIDKIKPDDFGSPQ